MDLEDLATEGTEKKKKEKTPNPKILALDVLERD